MTSSMQKVKYSDNTQICVYLLCWLTSSVQSLSCIPPGKKEVILCKKKINFFPLCLMRCTLISFKKLTFFFFFYKLIFHFEHADRYSVARILQDAAGYFSEATLNCWTIWVLFNSSVPLMHLFIQMQFE